MKTVVETIKERLPITELLSSYIAVQQSGNQFKANCPFHNERTASFYISPDRGLYYCFGCGAKGDIFSFVEQFEGLDFKGTLKLLAERAGVPFTGQVGSYSDTDPIYEVLEKATLTYQGILEKSTSTKDYLLGRGLLKETIEAFRIGYVGDEWRTIESTCKSEAEQSIAIRAGLIKKTEGPPATGAGRTIKIYDRFRKRVLFPLTDSSGRVIGFSGRSFPEDGDDKSPKYLNSPETEVFQKSKTLFGFDKAKFHIKKNNFAILVEGQFDLVLSHQAGFRNTVASSGTAVSEDSAIDPFSNLSVLSRLTPHLFLAFDGDSAGQKAMDRAALVALSLGMNPKVVVLPEGVDPADFLKDHGAEDWKEKLKEAKHFIEHHLLKIRSQSLAPHAFARTIKEKLFPFLAKVASPIEKNLYIRMISTEIGIPEATILEELSGLVQPNASVAIPAKKPATSLESTPYERLTALRSCFASEDLEKVIEPLNTLTIADIVFSAPAVPEDRLARAGATVEKEYTNLSEVDRIKVAKELVIKITDTFLNDIRATYTNTLKNSEKNGEDAEVIRLSKIISEIDHRLHDHPQGGG